MHMKWASIIVSTAFALGFLSGCQTAQEPAPFKCSYQTPLQPGIPGSPENLIMLENRPSGVTELAAMMREMLDAMKERRAELIAQKTVQPLKNYERMKCAWPTDMDNRSAEFDVLANLTIQAIDSFNKTPNQDAYNTVVATCISCHQQRCPGPTAAIRPLLLEDEKNTHPLQDVDAGSCETPIKQVP